MKQILMVTVLLVISVVIVIPALVVRGLSQFEQTTGVKTNLYKGEDISIKVYMHEQDKIAELSLEEYVKGVVAAEMPAEFEMEALKAQAVAARTYAVKNMVFFGGTGSSTHSGADVSTDHRESQAWQSEANLKKRWGQADYDRYWQKISQAVEQTRGLIVVYNGEPINALFHSTSGEKTASAKEVWGFDYPYLKSVICHWDQKSPRYSDFKDISFVELEQKLGNDAGIMTASQSGAAAAIAQIIDRTESDRVDKIRIGSKTLSGTAVREKLDLRSANFTVDIKNDSMIFKTTGYGHGVGLCQYGANGMAKEGRNFQQILTYYYTGVTIKNIFGS